jgi:hypothetical protein
MSVDADTVECSSRPEDLRSVGVIPRRVEVTYLRVFHLQFDIVAHLNCWKVNGSAVHLHIILQGQVADVRHSVPSGVTYQIIVATSKVCYGDSQLAAAYGSQFKSRTHLSGESIQEFAFAIKQVP